MTRLVGDETFRTQKLALKLDEVSGTKLPNPYFRAKYTICTSFEGNNPPEFYFFTTNDVFPHEADSMTILLKNAESDVDYYWGIREVIINISST